MGNEAVGFTVMPKVVLEDTTVAIRIAPVPGGPGFDPQAVYELTQTPMEDIGSFSSFSETRQPVFEIRDGVLHTRITLEGEQEHGLFVERIDGEERISIGDFRIYSVADDLFQRRPYKGDLHIHSNRSDGREDPGYVAASCRKIGLDFMALTDHGLYEPSIECQQAFVDVDVDLRIFRGEEVHPPDNPIHIINFGGESSVNALFKEPSYFAEVSEIQKGLTDIPHGLDPYYYASSLWCFDKIREFHGLGIFCHPYWIASRRYHIPGALTSKIFDEQPFDAYELIGGYNLNEVESNMLQVLRYQEESAKGREVPIVGVSDAHGCDRGTLFGWYYSIVFSKSTDLPELIDSVKQQYSVAVEHLPESTARAHGPLRLSKYAHFLMREVLPGHDMLCREEGELMLEYYAGDDSVSGKLGELSGRAAAYIESCFAAGV
ncbi:MAG: hypothetical protein HN368_04485 [Spirochaetales bacterium]|jgi:hypothetical protein|nr:hypothetical protein [Spirochaetales bacterium]